MTPLEQIKNILFTISGISGILALLLVLRTGLPQHILHSIPWFKLLVIVLLVVIIWGIFR